MATKMENRVGVNFAIFGINPWRQFIELFEICCKDTNMHEMVENKISDFWLHKAQNVRACHRYRGIDFLLYGQIKFHFSDFGQFISCVQPYRCVEFSMTHH